MIWMILYYPPTFFSIIPIFLNRLKDFSQKKEKELFFLFLFCLFYFVFLFVFLFFLKNDFNGRVFRISDPI